MELSTLLHVREAATVERDKNDVRPFPKTKIDFDGHNGEIKFKNGPVAVTNRGVGKVEFEAPQVAGNEFAVNLDFKSPTEGNIEITWDDYDAKVRPVSIENPQQKMEVPPPPYHPPIKPEGGTTRKLSFRIPSGKTHGVVVYFGTTNNDDDGFPKDGLAVTIYRMNEVVVVAQTGLERAKEILQGTKTIED